mmetsp:Transcript_29346/g.77580  ORF Transcript_29346/g.77580 Transcript_29346/m.77580 type:complete len:251 (-) Transcript_29346:54-806(-)
MTAGDGRSSRVFVTEVLRRAMGATASSAELRDKSCFAGPIAMIGPDAVRAAAQDRQAPPSLLTGPAPERKTKRCPWSDPPASDAPGSKPPAKRLSKKTGMKTRNPPVSPEEDPYDPRKPEYIRSASVREVVEESARQRRKAITSLEGALSSLEGRRAEKPGVLRHYRTMLQEMHPGRRAKPGALREARDVPLPHDDQAPPPPPTNSCPAAGFCFYSPTQLTSESRLPPQPGPPLPTSSAPAVPVKLLESL